MSKSHLKSPWAVVAVLLGFILQGSAFGEPDEREATEVRLVIESQLAAFAADDAARAFSFASPTIRHMFATPDDFIAMVKSTYPVVYRHASVLFMPFEYVEDVPIQIVQMSDAAGQVWLALYKMQKQTDGSWRIDGCVVRPAPSKSA
ncbi:MAG: DUF4864 domain-containing protein [Betaproteobacteria bacterium]